MREINQDLNNITIEEDDFEEEKHVGFMDNNYWKPSIYDIEQDIEDLLNEKNEKEKESPAITLDDVQVIINSSSNLDYEKILQVNVEAEVVIESKYARLLNRRKSSCNNLAEQQYLDNIYWKMPIESVDISGLLVDN